MGAAFIQYLIYAGLYIVEGNRYIEFYEETKAKAPATTAAQAPAQKEELGQNIGPDGNPTDANEVNIDLGGNGGQTQQSPVPSIDPPSADGEEDLAEFESAPFVHLASKNF